MKIPVSWTVVVVRWCIGWLASGTTSHAADLTPEHEKAALLNRVLALEAQVRHLVPKA